MKKTLCYLILPVVLAAASCVVRAAPTCTVAAVNLNFPGYDFLRASPTDSIGSVNVRCTGIAGDVASYTMQLGPGGSGAVGARAMAVSGRALNYNLYADAARASVWGDGNSGTTVISDSVVLSVGGSDKSYPVYGRIPARQNLPVGTYTDLITVTLSF